MIKKLAVWMHGGIGTGHFAQGLPTMEMLLNGLSEFNEIVIYSHRAPNAGYQSVHFRVITAPENVKANVLRWAFLIGYFIRDHLKKKFDVVFSFWGYPAGFITVVLGKLFGIASVVYLLGADAVGIPSIRYGILINPFSRALAFWAYRRTSSLISLSSFQQSQLALYGFKRPMKVIPWGTDLSMFQFKPRPLETPLHIIHVGHHTPVKDQITLLKTFSLIMKRRPAKLRIFGGDDLGGILKHQVSELSLTSQVEFMGVVPYSEMPGHYAWAHLMIHTSLSEGQCGALTEAAACGVLMAGTKVGLLSDLDDEFAIRVETGNYEALAAKILSAMDDGKTWKKRLDNARSWSVDHDLTWTIRTLTELIFTLPKKK